MIGILDVHAQVIIEQLASRVKELESGPPVDVALMRAEIRDLREALGLLTTLAPKMEIDPSDPVGMAKEVEAHVSKQYGILEAVRRKAEEIDPEWEAREGQRMTCEKAVDVVFSQYDWMRSKLDKVRPPFPRISRPC